MLYKSRPVVKSGTDTGHRLKYMPFVAVTRRNIISGIINKERGYYVLNEEDQVK